MVRFFCIDIVNFARHNESVGGDHMPPKFYEWLDDNKPGWVLKKDAPPEVVKEFEEYKKRDEEAEKKGIIID